MGASDSPSASPSESPSLSPSASTSPSRSPSSSPSGSPSKSASSSPSESPSASPSPIAAGEVTYTIRGNVIKIGRKKLVFVQIAFGGAPDAYPPGGIPLTAGKMGIGNVDAVVILEANAKGLNYEWDRSANSIRIFATYGTEVDTYETLAATTLEVMVVGW